MLFSTLAVSQSYDYTNSTAAASVMQGEPPPPGTDLDLLLAAPPPPPPPADEDSTGPMEAYDTSVPMAMTSHPLTYSGIDGDPMVHSSVSDTSMYPSETGIMSTESSYVSERTDAPPLVTQEPVVIARPPQVFARGDEPGSSAEVMSGTEAMPESGPGEDISPSPAVAALSVAAELPSSSGITSEKKKKKKDKVLRLTCIYRCTCIYITSSFNSAMGIHVIATNGMGNWCFQKLQVNYIVNA